MFKLSSETELLECFRPLEREEVLLPEKTSYPLFVKDYLAWLEPSGVRVYLVFAEATGKPPMGIVFRRDQTPGQAASMCEWCHTIRAGDNVGLLTATASSHRRVGVNLCRDLSCNRKIETDLTEVQSPQERLRRVVERMTSFARQQLY